jgi:activating signal cointegrator complex subunit 3
MRQGYPGKHYCPRMATMNKPCYAAIKQHSPDRPTLIFVASRRQTRLTAFDIISFAAGDDNPKSFLGCDETYIESIATTIQDDALRHTITFGVGLHHAGLSSHDRDIVERLYLAGDIRVLVATATLAWGKFFSLLDSSLILYQIVFSFHCCCIWRTTTSSSTCCDI